VSMPHHAAKHRHFGPMSPPDNAAIRSGGSPHRRG
jgi:hypothetical protein